MSLKFYKFGSQWGIADLSAFCVKLENFLRLHNIPFEEKNFKMEYLKKAPKKKFPFIEFPNGELLGDSSLIIERLCQEHNIDLSKDLTVEQKAISHAFCRMLDEATYFGLLYSRWIDEKGWNVISPIFFGSLPALLRGYISSKARKDMISSIWKQGTARHTQEEVYASVCADLDALSDLLGKDEWFFGQNKPGLLDICAHANIINLTRVPIENEIKAHVMTRANLCDHAERFQELVYTTI